MNTSNVLFLILIMVLGAATTRAFAASYSFSVDLEPYKPAYLDIAIDDESDSNTFSVDFHEQQAEECYRDLHFGVTAVNQNGRSKGVEKVDASRFRFLQPETIAKVRLGIVATGEQNIHCEGLVTFSSESYENNAIVSYYDENYGLEYRHLGEFPCWYGLDSVGLCQAMYGSEWRSALEAIYRRTGIGDLMNPTLNKIEYDFITSDFGRQLYQDHRANRVVYELSMDIDTPPYHACLAFKDEYEDLRGRGTRRRVLVRDVGPSGFTMTSFVCGRQSPSSHD